MISIDIDHFKKINDSHGHLVGDWVLTNISELMKGRLRSTDIIGRMGGEEFLVLLPNTSEHDAMQVAENLRQKISQAEFSSENDARFVVTAGGGVLGMTENMDSVEDLLRRPDRLLYEAKEPGRNMFLAPGTSSKTESYKQRLSHDTPGQ